MAQRTDLFRQESTNKWYCNTVKDLLLPNTVSKKDEKPHTTGPDDTAMPHIKITSEPLLMANLLVAEKKGILTKSSFLDSSLLTLC